MTDDAASGSGANPESILNSHPMSDKRQHPEKGILYNIEGNIYQMCN